MVRPNWVRVQLEFKPRPVWAQGSWFFWTSPSFLGASLMKETGPVPARWRLADNWNGMFGCFSHNLYLEAIVIWSNNNLGRTHFSPLKRHFTIPVSQKSTEPYRTTHHQGDLVPRDRFILWQSVHMHKHTHTHTLPACTKISETHGVGRYFPESVSCSVMSDSLQPYGL